MILRAAAAAAFALVATGASAAEFASIANAGAILYDGPSPSATRVFVAPRGMPVELLSVIRLWVRVRDAAGDVMWVERSDLSPQRTVVTRVPAMVRTHANDAAEVLFQADRGVLLELVEPVPAPGWARVRHRDGTAGYVRAGEVWGL